MEPSRLALALAERRESAVELEVGLLAVDPGTRAASFDSAAGTGPSVVQP